MATCHLMRKAALRSLKLYKERVHLDSAARAATARAVCRHCGLSRSTVAHESSTHTSMDAVHTHITTENVSTDDGLTSGTSGVVQHVASGASPADSIGGGVGLFVVPGGEGDTCSSSTETCAGGHVVDEGEIACDTALLWGTVRGLEAV